MLALFVHRWNIDRAVERGLIDEQYQDVYHQEVILELKEMSELQGGHPVHGDFVSCRDFLDTKERFFTPVIQALTRLQEESGRDMDMDIDYRPNVELSASMRFAANRDGEDYELPITPVLQCEEELVDEMAPQFRKRRGSNRNQQTSYDTAAMAVQWNFMCAEELLKPAMERQKIYRKNAQHLEAFFKKRVRTENARRTERQPVVVDGPNGLSQTTLVRRAVGDVRRQFRDDAADMMPASELFVPSPLARPTSVERGQGDAVHVPPIELTGSNHLSLVRQRVEAGRHLQMPTSRLVPAPSRNLVNRCRRCGKHLAGREHKAKAARTSVEYCTVPESERLPHWEVQPGYVVGDTRKAIDGRTMRRAWKRRKTQLGLPLHEESFPGW